MKKYFKFIITALLIVTLIFILNINNKSTPYSRISSLINHKIDTSYQREYYSSKDHFHGDGIKYILFSLEDISININENKLWHKITNSNYNDIKKLITYENINVEIIPNITNGYYLIDYYKDTKTDFILYVYDIDTNKLYNVEYNS